jgi:hypothetical protein
VTGTRLRPGEMREGDVVLMDVLTDDHRIQRVEQTVEKITHPMPQRYVITLDGTKHSTGARQTWLVVRRAGEEA